MLLLLSGNSFALAFVSSMQLDSFLVREEQFEFQLDLARNKGLLQPRHDNPEMTIVA